MVTAYDEQFSCDEAHINYSGILDRDHLIVSVSIPLNPTADISHDWEQAERILSLSTICDYFLLQKKMYRYTAV